MSSLLVFFIIKRLTHTNIWVLESEGWQNLADPLLWAHGEVISYSNFAFCTNSNSQPLWFIFFFFFFSFLSFYFLKMVGQELSRHVRLQVGQILWGSLSRSHMKLLPALTGHLLHLSGTHWPWNPTPLPTTHPSREKSTYCASLNKAITLSWNAQNHGFLGGENGLYQIVLLSPNHLVCFYHMCYEKNSREKGGVLFYFFFFGLAADLYREMKRFSKPRGLLHCP